MEMRAAQAEMSSTASLRRRFKMERLFFTAITSSPALHGRAEAAHETRRWRSG